MLGPLLFSLAVNAVPAGAVSDAPPISASSAEILLFADEPEVRSPPRCAEAAEETSRTRCLISLRYRADPTAAKVALNLFERTGCVAGLTPEQDFDGGFRGIIRLTPDLPTGDKRKHLEWVAQALADFDTVLERLANDASSFAYRWRSLEVGFYRSLKKRTPAAWAGDWAVNYNTNGTLNWGPDVVRELLFHEVFHLNDQTHDRWSRTALTPLYDEIVKRCGSDKACLEPWAPVETTTKGTYYAFLPANGVGEYAAELATRFYREQRMIIRGGKVPRPFKCRTKENARAWALLVSEFYGNVDLVPACH